MINVNINISVYFVLLDNFKYIFDTLSIDSYSHLKCLFSPKMKFILLKINFPF